MLFFLEGLVMGFFTVGVYTLQTLKVLSGQPFQTLLASLGVSALYWVSINRIVDDNAVWYAGFTVGAALATTGLSVWEKKKSLKADSERGVSNATETMDGKR